MFHPTGNDICVRMTQDGRKYVHVLARLRTAQQPHDNTDIAARNKAFLSSEKKEKSAKRSAFVSKATGTAPGVDIVVIFLLHSYPRINEREEGIFPRKQDSR